MLVTIGITKEHIAKGFPENCTKCPVALAICEITNHNIIPKISEVEVSWLNAKTGSTFSSSVLPDAAQNFIRDFDAADPIDRVQPFEFKLDIPPAFVV